MKKLFFAGLLTAIVGGSVVAASLPFQAILKGGIQYRYKWTITIPYRRVLQVTRPPSLSPSAPIPTTPNVFL